MAMGFNCKPVSDWLKTDPFKEYFVFWDEIGFFEIELFKNALKNAKGERDLQRFLEYHPIMLIQHLGGGQGRWVIPKKKLGSRYEIDFLVADKDSQGFHWMAIELESPFSKTYKKNGDPTKELSHAMQQIRNWRAWIRDNQAHAQNPVIKNGLELPDITSDGLPGLIIIGRRDTENEKYRFKRRDLGNEANMKIHSYDWLLEQASGRVMALKRHTEKDEASLIDN
jgi:hypothetical protein